ncbi:MAG: RHS repeat-associated core domain-containing protein, partial [Thermoflexales bacterium]
EMSGTQPFTYTQGWTVDNRLAIVVKSDVTGTILATTTIGYDGDGVRVKKVDPSGTTYYLGAVEVLITGTTQLTTSYYAFGGAMVAMRATATATLTYLHGDHLGSVSLTTNAAGQKVSEQRYKPYGEVRWSSGSMPTDFTFTSQRASSYGTIFMSAREYLPSLGRFLSADSIVPGAGNPQALNRYSYVFNSPLGFVDPSGHDPAGSQNNCNYGAQGCGGAGSQTDIETQHIVLAGTLWYYEKIQAEYCAEHVTECDVKNAINGAFMLAPVAAVGAGFIGVATEAASGVSAAAPVAATAYQVVRAAQDVWKMRPFDRGQAIEDLLGRSPNLVRNFPGIDRFTNGVATSIKSIDVGAKTY